MTRKKKSLTSLISNIGSDEDQHKLAEFLIDAYRKARNETRIGELK